VLVEFILITQDFLRLTLRPTGSEKYRFRAELCDFAGTVNLMAYAFEGSNPSAPIWINLDMLAGGCISMQVSENYEVMIPTRFWGASSCEVVLTSAAPLSAALSMFGLSVAETV
jgi:hypothetical protein